LDEFRNDSRDEVKGYRQNVTRPNNYMNGYPGSKGNTDDRGGRNLQVAGSLHAVQESVCSHYVSVAIFRPLGLVFEN
jgi:hypothetical protein